MKKVRGTLEYRVVKPFKKRKAQWTFSFKTLEGHTLIESAQAFDSRAKAERGFVTFIKSIATNQYQVEFPKHSTN